MTVRGRDQDQFLVVLDRDEAERRFRAVLDLTPLGEETVPLAEALGRVLARPIVSPVDLPSFDRSNFDGFAVRAADTFGSTEERPRRLRLNAERLAPGVVPGIEIAPGTATPIATGAMVPRGADAVVMVERTDPEGDAIRVRRPVAPADGIAFAGSDIARGETVLFGGQILGSRETGVLAAIGLAEAVVRRRPRVAILSTGDEILPPGAPMRPGFVFDSNATTLADAVREIGGDPVALGIVRDDLDSLRERLRAALVHDVVVLSGGTSKGEGDLCYRAVAELPRPGIVAHGVALKPGKPICLAAAAPPSGDRNVPVVILPGFPTSAVFTFHEFVAPVIRALAGRRDAARGRVEARMPIAHLSERGRTEYLLVGLVEGADGLAAYPMGKGSGSVTAFGRADGFVVIPRDRERLDEGESVTVERLGGSSEPADLVAIGSHCVGLDLLLGALAERGMRVKSMAVGSTGGLRAASRGECDIAGVHLLDAESDTYNVPFLPSGVSLASGYTRMQGVVFRPGDPRFAGCETAAEALEAVLADGAGECRMVNRNRGSGTRVLLDRHLGDRRPPGFAVEVRSHNAVAAAVEQGRADWGIAIETVARAAGLAFLPLREEAFDFAIPDARRDRAGVRAFLELLADPGMRERLRSLGFGAP